MSSEHKGRRLAAAPGRTSAPGSASVAAVRSLAAGRAAALLRLVADDLYDQADEIAATMVRAYEREIPAYAAISDEALKDDVRSVSSAMVRCWLTVMSTGKPLDQELLTPILEGTRRRVAQGFDLQSLLRAYRVGIRVMWTEITSSAAWRGQELQGVLAQVGTWALDFADRVTTAVAAAYLDEKERRVRDREHRRSTLLNVILAGPPAEPVDQLRELELPHAVVVASVQPGLDLIELERTGQLFEERAEALLWTVRHRSVVAAVAWPESPRREQLMRRMARLVGAEPLEAIGIGGRAESVAETRQSYAEATAALQVGLLLGTARGPVYDFQELAALIALLEQPERARRFASSALEPLRGLRNRAWLLPTLEAYLVHHGRMKQVAADLGVHLNTVKYRIREVRSVAGAGFAEGDRTTTLLLALRVQRVLDAETTGRGVRVPPQARALA